MFVQVSQNLCHTIPLVLILDKEAALNTPLEADSTWQLPMTQVTGV